MQNDSKIQSICTFWYSEYQHANTGSETKARSIPLHHQLPKELIQRNNCSWRSAIHYHHRNYFGDRITQGQAPTLVVMQKSIGCQFISRSSIYSCQHLVKISIWVLPHMIPLLQCSKCFGKLSFCWSSSVPSFCNQRSHMVTECTKCTSLILTSWAHRLPQKGTKVHLYFTYEKWKD